MSAFTTAGYEFVTFLSDLGTADEYVGVVESTIAALAPRARVIHLSHDIEVHNVRGAALVLVRSAPHLVPGVVLASVDAGASSRNIAVEVGGGESVLVGPDNGLLAPVVAMVGGASRVVQIGASSASVFPARDVLAPAAAQLCNGVDLGELGDPVDVDSLVPAMVSFSTRDGDSIAAEVVHVDRFGNASLDVSVEQIEDMGNDLLLGGSAMTSVSSRVVHHYSELGDGETGLLVEPNGAVMVVVNGASASTRHALGVGTAVTLSLGS